MIQELPTIAIQLSTVDAGRTELMEKQELDHPNYDFININKLFNINPADFINRWIDTKAITRNAQDNKSVINELWINTNPFTPNDNVNGYINNQNWSKYFEWIDTGQDTGRYNYLVWWGGKITTFRVNEYQNIDFKKISVRDIDPTGTVTPPYHACPAGFHWDESSQSYQPDVVHLPPCDPGFHWDEAQQKCVPDDVVVPPSGDVLWDSNTNGHWNNGHSRVITLARQFDPDDPTTEVAAGSVLDRRFEVKGDGTALLSGANARIYTHVNNYDAQMEVTFVMNSTLDNLSLRLRSRHNEYDPHENRFGGFGCSIAHGTFKIQRENFHNDHTNIKNDTSLPRNLENGKSYTVRFSVFDDANKKVVHKIEIDYDGNGTFTPIITINDNNPFAYMVDRNRYEGSGDKSYIWVRTDGRQSKERGIKEACHQKDNPLYYLISVN